MTTNRKRPSWDEYFLEIAHVASTRSPDPDTQVGCCIVKDKQILSTGYNGWIGDVDTSKFPTSREKDERGMNKYEVFLHSEINALLQCAKYGISTTGATCYCTFMPCLHCLQSLIQAGISEIVYPKVNSQTAKYGIKPETQPYYDLILNAKSNSKKQLIIRTL